MNALIDVLLYLVIILSFGGAAMFFLHMIVRLITAIRECNRDLKEQEEKRKAARDWPFLNFVWDVMKYESVDSL